MELKVTMTLSFLISLVYSGEEGIFAKIYDKKIVNFSVSGNSYQYVNGTKRLTKPEYAIYPFDKLYDWCSNCPLNYDDHPFIMFYVENHEFKFNGYLIRAGCCDEGCCCDDTYYGCAYCCLYSWSIQISNDNQTWTTVHSIAKDAKMRDCKEATFQFEKYYVAKYVRLIQDERCPGYPPCLAINRIDFFGTALSSGVEEEFVSYHDDDEDVSIIGHISKNGNARFN